jgi:thioredoxin 1
MITVKKFSASWCSPCKTLKPIFEEVRNGYGSNIVKFEEYDVDEASDVASKYNIRSVPTVIIEKNGQEVGRFAGVQSKLAYVNSINEHILK